MAKKRRLRKLAAFENSKTEVPVEAKPAPEPAPIPEPPKEEVKEEPEVVKPRRSKRLWSRASSTEE
jgi:hypothetical protein